MNSPYLLLPIGILTLLLYFISTLLLKQGVVSKLWHRRFWNILLLLTFMTVCILGLLLAIQINYKLNWPIVKALLKWHVDFGIAMSIIAFIHLWWHLNYYLELFKKKPVSAKVIDEIKDSRPESNEPTSTPLILLSGFISTIIQVLLIREITTVFQGNELMIGWMLGAWMLLTGIGAFLGRTIHTLGNIRSVLLKAIFVISIIPVFIVVSINLLKNQLFPPGIMVNPAYFLVALFLMLLPICLLAGIVYSLLVKVNRNRTDTAVWVYSMESFGSLAGGIVVSFVMVIWLSVLQSLLIVAIISLTLLFVLSRKRIYAFWGFSYIIILLLVLIFPVDLWIKSKLYTSQEIIKSDETYYGNLTVTKNAGQYNFFQSGSLLSSTGNIIANEEDVHYAMLQRTEAKNVLILSAGAIGTITEVLKYNAIKSFDFVELNPQLLDIFLSYSPLPNDERLHIYSGDGKLFIRKTKKKYDLVIFALPDPASIQINRYYTDEFIKNCKKKLSPNAVVCYSSSPAGNYISPGKIKTEATLYNTLKANFNQVRIVPGEKDYFLASDSAIDIHISKLSNSRGVEAEYVNKFYIDDFSIEQREEYILQSIRNIKEINSDRRPFPVYYHSLQFISQFISGKKYSILLPLLLVVLPLFLMRPVTKGMYIAGFTGASVELIVLFAFQLIFGYVYAALGIIIAIFMGGLATGSLLSNKFNLSKKHFIWVQVLLGLFVMVLPILWQGNSLPENTFLQMLLFFILTLIPAILVGFLYASGTYLYSGDAVAAAPAVYAADLAGSALGVVVLAVFLLPLLGIVYSCMVIAGFNFAGALLNLHRI